MKILRKNKINDIFARQQSIQALAFNLYIDNKITDQEYTILIQNALGTINTIGGQELVNKAKTELNEAINGGLNEN